MTNEEILDLISQGEGITIEFKECINEISAEVYPTVCSFSNRFGGHILMGVADNGEIIGVNPNCIKNMRKNFINTLNNPEIITPSLYLSAEEVVIDDKIILCVYVPTSSQVHTCKKQTYDRIGDADINISKNTTQMSALYLRKQKDFTEKKIFPYLTIDDLDLSLMNRVRNLAKSKDPNHPWIEMDDMGIFRSAVLYERDFETGQEGFNLAAVLLFGKNETIQSCLPAYRTDAIYREANMDRYDDRDDVRTNLIDSYDRLTDFICRHIDDKFCLEGTQRVSVRSIIAREIVSNILMHREYMSPYPARIIIEKDKIMTENANKTCHYGRVLTTSTPFPKNPTIAKFFNNIGRADELGSGVRNLYKYTKMYSDSEPLLFEDDVFKVEIPLGFINGGDKAAISGDKTKSERISTQEHDILQYIIKNGAISNAQACELLNLKSSRVREIFNSMLDKDLIDHVGEKKNRKYVINTKE
ncbi:MAG: putative DNA binding domain-containing protein [Ruminococcus sp.]|nr:putative DNA binding domain-containing protein [Ruminococcus sp.]